MIFEQLGVLIHFHIAMNTITRIFTLFLAFHILNFSLDIPSYDLSSSDSKIDAHGNPIDFECNDEIESILELVIETALEQDDFFPDTEEADSQTESFLKKVDWITHSFWLKFSFIENIYTCSEFVTYTVQFQNLSQDISSPPPKI